MDIKNVRREGVIDVTGSYKHIGLVLPLSTSVVFRWAGVSMIFRRLSAPVRPGALQKQPFFPVPKVVDLG